jgi:phosphoserine phosphatase
VPVFWAADKLSRKWFNEIFYRSYAGESEDRLVVLAEELFEDVIKPNIYPRAKDLIANKLEFVDCYATGKLQKPFVAGATKADIMRAYAKEHGVDLAESWAYTDSFSDYPMLAVVGHPTACNPDFRLRSLCRSYDWPVLELDEEPSRAASRRPQGLARPVPRSIRRPSPVDKD